jgi:hypothetical protein
VKAYNAVIVWTPSNIDNIPPELRGKVEVRTPQSCRDWTKPPFSRSCGANLRSTRALRGDAAVMVLFIDFHTLIVRDGIDPKAAHEAFLAIDEYRRRISHDIEGAE